MEGATLEIREEVDAWSQFVAYIEDRCSATAFQNWIAPISCIAQSGDEVVLQVPNVFVKEYLLQNYAKELSAFMPLTPTGELDIEFVVAQSQAIEPTVRPTLEPTRQRPNLNPSYQFGTYIEGPTNQFVKSAAQGVAARPGQSYNPLFIHGGVGLGKTHLLHSIGHSIVERYPKLKVECITTEGFINDLVDSLRNKTVDKMKRHYRSLDVLLVDDIQFLQNRLNFEEEFCNMFEALINQNKQIVITSDKPPGQLKLSERIVARMEWGLVASVTPPDLETRVAIIMYKGEQRGLHIPQNIAFYIAEHVYANVRQLEGAINRLLAQSSLLNCEITEELVEGLLRELWQQAPKGRVSVEDILKGVATIFETSITALKGNGRTKEVALSRQVAMFLAREMVNDSLMMIAASFGGRAHSTIIHACQQMEKKILEDERLRRRIEMVRRLVGER